MAAGDLTTIANATAWAGAGATQELISAASSQIQAWLGYQIASQPYTRRFNGRGGTTMTFPDRPVTAVASLTFEGTNVPASPNAPQPGFLFDDKQLYLIGYRFPRGPQSVSVTYTAGYETTPDDIEQACLILIKATMDRQSREDGLKAQRAGDTEFQYATPRQSDASPSMLLPDDVLALLMPYRRVAPC